jgi:hypothetical protein
MSFKIRQISVLLRRWDSLKDRRRVLRRFSEWREDQNSLPPPGPLVKRLLIIRLDDIGDYLLFRNQLGLYKKSPRWQGYSITLLGNASWQPVFTLLDSATVDETLWVNKNRYLQQADYRREIWRQLRAQGFDVVIAPSRTQAPLTGRYVYVGRGTHPQSWWPEHQCAWTMESTLGRLLYGAFHAHRYPVARVSLQRRLCRVGLRHAMRIPAPGHRPCLSASGLR